MGQLRFVTPDRDRLPPGAVERAYLTGMEGVPFASHNFWEGEQFVIERDVRESGNLHILWPVADRGPMLLTTASLMERDRPYLLPVELARGMLNRVRQQEAQWQAAGLTVTPEYDALQQEAQRHLGLAITQQTDPRTAQPLADAAIVASLAASDALCAAYRRQILAARHQQSAQLPTLLGATLPASPLAAPQLKQFQTAFNAAAVPLLWRDIEATEGSFDWSLADAQFQAIQKSSLKICTGPLLRLDSSALPDWLYLWEDDFESLQGCIYQFLTAVVERYRGHVQVWHCAAGMNLPGGLLLTEEQKLRLAVLSIDTIRRADAKTPIVMSFDQPWGEYLQVAELDLPAYHFADALVRADLGLAGVGLEINLGYWPGGTLPRDGLEVSRMVDRWTALGVPLLAILTAPSAHGEDSLARHKAEVVMPATPASQASALGPMLEMLIAKHSIHGVVWNQLSDGQPHAWPHGGVWDVAGKPKPLFYEIAKLRKAHLA